MTLVLLLIEVATAFNNSWAAVIIDTRFDSAVVSSISNARHHMPRYATIYILTGRENWPSVDNVLRDMPNVQIIYYNFVSSSQRDYNSFLLSKEMWNLFKEEYILVFHRDSRFCSYSHQRIERFIGHYDFIGAPWSEQITEGVQIGNGGFSLRCRQAMLRCVESEHLVHEWNEDASMVHCLKKLGLRLPSIEIASEFSVETIRFSKNIPLAIHKAWHYIDKDFELARYCPESVKI